MCSVSGRLHANSLRLYNQLHSVSKDMDTGTQIDGGTQIDTKKSGNMDGDARGRTQMGGGGAQMGERDGDSQGGGKNRLGSQKRGH